MRGFYVNHCDPWRAMGDEGKANHRSAAAQTDLVVRYAAAITPGTPSPSHRALCLAPDPSGILYPRVICLLGGGMVVNPQRLLAEMDGLAAPA